MSEESVEYIEDQEEEALVPEDNIYRCYECGSENFTKIWGLKNVKNSIIEEPKGWECAKCKITLDLQRIVQTKRVNMKKMELKRIQDQLDQMENNI